MYRSPFGKKGGTSANAGKKAVTYIVPLPDGRSVPKKTFDDFGESAFAGIYEHKGVWYISGIVSQPQNWGTQQFIPVQRRN